MTEFLLNMGCNPYLDSQINNKQVETNLSCAARWGHITIVELLVNLPQWTPKDLETAKRSSANIEVKKIIMNKISQNKKNRKRTSSLTSCLRCSRNIKIKTTVKE